MRNYRKKNKREYLSADITPLIDVVFILLVFFMVTSVFRPNDTSLKLDLPSSSSSEIEKKIKNITISLNEKELFFMNQPIILKNLDKKLLEIKNKNTEVQLKIDKKVTYEKVIKILDLLQFYSFNNLILITTREVN